jgi:ketosteroid isomerase-like protein
MPQADIEGLRAGYEAISRGDFERPFRDVNPDFELTTPPGINAGTYRGREECQAYLDDMTTALETWTVEPEEFFESGDQIVVFVKIRARPKGSSAEIEIRNGHLWRLRDGKPLSMRFFPAPEQALEAAGLRE